MGEDLESVKRLASPRSPMEERSRWSISLANCYGNVKSKDASGFEHTARIIKAMRWKKPFHQWIHAVSKALRDGKAVLSKEILRSDPGTRHLETVRLNSAFQLPLHEAVTANKIEVITTCALSARGRVRHRHEGTIEVYRLTSINHQQRHRMISRLIGNGANKEAPNRVS